MKVFLAGATGAIGRRLVPRLVEAGHEVAAITRKEKKLAELSELGAERSHPRQGLSKRGAGVAQRQREPRVAGQRPE